VLHRSGWKSQRFLPVQYLLSTSNLSPLGLEPLFLDFSSHPAKRNICIAVISFFGHFPKAFLNPFSLAQPLWNSLLEHLPSATGKNVAIHPFSLKCHVSVYIYKKVKKQLKI
jgi:hypothetical protein